MMELMMAIGIFAIGMGLIAGLFPAAVKESESAVKDYEGPTICQNGLAIVKARVTHTAADTPVGDSLGKLTDAAIVIGDGDMEYRTANGRTRGFVALAKQWADGRNDYQIVIVAYDIASANDIEVPTALSVTITEGDESFTYSGDKAGLIGSPVIDANSGRYATITGIDGNEIHLDHPFGENSTSVLVIREVSGTTPQDTSPVIGVMMTRTALRDSSSGGGGGGGMPSQ